MVRRADSAGSPGRQAPPRSEQAAAGSHIYLVLRARRLCFQPDLAGDLRRYRSAFTPAISPEALKKISCEVRSWRIHTRTRHSLQELADGINPVVRGWMTY